MKEVNNKIENLEIDLSSIRYGTIIKESDDKFNGNHPNGIHKGYMQKGDFLKVPTINEYFYIGSLRTSPVTEIISETNKEMIFKTVNSTYKLIIEDDRS